MIGIKYDRLGINVGSLPFAPADATAGSESEMQTVVMGKRTDVDLPLVIEQSNYLTNIRKRAKSGDSEHNQGVYGFECFRGNDRTNFTSQS